MLCCCQVLRSTTCCQVAATSCRPSWPQRTIRLRMSFWKQLPPMPVASQRAAMLLMELEECVLGG